MEAQIVATRLMLELTGARLVPGHDRRRRRRARPAASSACASTACAELLGRRRSRARARPRSCARSASASQEAPGGLDVLVPAFRRNDVTREADLVEEVARIDGLEKLPGHAARAPRQRRAAERRAAPAPPRRSTRSSGRGLYEIVGWSFTEPGLADRLRLAPDDPRRRFVVLENPMSEDHSVLRTTLLGVAARRRAPQRRARAGRPRALRGRHRLPRRRRRSCPHEHRALGGVLDRAPAPADVGHARAAARGLLRRQGPARRRARRACACAGTVEPATEPFLHPGRSARVLAGGEDVGWIGELHPLVARAWDLDHGAALFEVDLDRVARATPTRCRATSTSRASRRCAWTSRSTLADDVAGRDACSPPCARPAASCWPTRASSTSTAASRWGRGASRWRSRSPSARADRTLTDEDVAPAARARSSPRCATSWGASCVPSVLVAGASGYTGALAAPLLDAPPALRPRRRSRAASDVGTRLSDLYPHHRVPLTLEELDARAPRRRSTRRSSPTRTAPPRRWSPRCTSAACAWSTCRPTSACATRGHLRAVVRPAPAPRAHRRGGLRAARAAPRADRGRRHRRQPRAASRPRRCWRWRRSAPWLDDVVIDAKTGVSGAGRAPTATHALRLGRRERRRPTASAGHRHVPEIDQELAFLGAPIRATFVPHLLPLDQGELVSCYVHAARAQVDVDALFARAYASEPFVELTDRPPGRARRARHELLPHPRARRRAHAARSSSSRRSTTCGRAPSSQAVQNLNLMFGLRRDGRACCERRSSPRAGSRCPSTCARTPRAACPAGFRAAGVAAGHQAQRRHRRRPARLRRARDHERRALHALGRRSPRRCS